MKTIEIKCLGHVNLDYTSFIPFQGNLKELSKQNYERLKKSILSFGFSEPFNIWQQEEKNYILGGHQRLRAIKQMVEQEGYSCPPLPCNLIEAKDEKEAKKKVLALTSQFGEITPEGLYEFMNEAEIDFEEIEASFRFPEVNFDNFKAEYFESEDEETDGQQIQKTKSVICPNCEESFEVSE